MMVRNDNFSSNSNTLALYCQWLSREAKEYEYIDFIIDDIFYITYYPMEDDKNDYTYNVYVKVEQTSMYHDVKVVGKLKDVEEFEVGYAILCYEKVEEVDKSVYLSDEYRGGAIIDFSKIVMPRIEVVEVGS